ncbi:Vinorine synthase [Quillaja saponaria]|uniref:Vinorine synthase n=1 Tax=Quillaja saponaria TaxID=32244 RepID=A0AAD7LIC3_QUISA|nr:Vinorine synthase [Quillaja saponaria]
MEVKIERIKKKTIKQATPTPSQLRNFKLCLFDQLGPAAYGSLVLFYPNNSDGITGAERSHLLKKSLSAILTHYYPFAGRIKDNIIIECEDQGVEYVEARANILLSTFLQQPDGTSRGSQEVVLPEFNGISHFPPIDFSPVQPLLELKNNKCVSKRYVFDASKTEVLRATAASSTVPRPTRVEAVMALIWKCSTKASMLSNSKSPKRYALALAVNIRKRVVPALPQNSIGILLVPLSIECNEESGADLKGLVAEIRKGKGEFRHKFAQRLQGTDALQVISEHFKKAREIMGNDCIKPSIFTSLCNFGLYDADFGWGKPIWVSIASAKHNNIISLIDTGGLDGIEAWVTLTEEDMASLNVIKSYLHLLLLIQVSWACPAASSEHIDDAGKSSSLLLQNINLAPRMVPPLVENTVMANLSWVFGVSMSIEEESEIELDGLVGQLREAMIMFCSTYAKRFRGNEWLSVIKECLNEARNLLQKQNKIVFRCSSWCRFPIYEVDFGWGKPMWASTAACVDKNIFILMDTKQGDGIEAYVTMEAQEMALFECEHDLFAFATCNPSPLIGI